MSASTSESPQPKRLVLVGAGYTHLLALKRIADLQNLPFEVTLISEHDHVPFHPMLVEFIGGFYKLDEIHFSVQPVVDAAKAEFVRDRVTGIDFSKKKITLQSGDKLSYDYISVGGGTRPNPQVIKGALEYAHFNKPVRAYQKAVMHFCDSLRGKRKVTLVQVGTEFQGLECILALVRRLKAYGVETKVHIIEASNRILPSQTRKAGLEMTKVLDRSKFQVHFETTLSEVSERDVVLSDGTRIPSDFTSIAAPAEAVQWLGKHGLEIYSKIVKVNHHLQASREDVFAVGDLAIDPERPWPRSYKTARKEARILVANVKAAALKQPLKKYRHPKSRMHFITDGDGRAMLTNGSVTLPLSGLFWRWKAKRDARFLRQFMQRSSSESAPEVSTPQSLPD